ncbi:Polygalacturonase, family GH28 [Pelomyxa schiedti]|nr:Polygalacturonase, family GH28 [Pelomyxa schiedti]
MACPTMCLVVVALVSVFALADGRLARRPTVTTNNKFQFPQLAQSQCGETGVLVNVVDYGGVPDGVTINTGAFREAVSAVSDAGGGCVVVPGGGTFRSGSIQLRDCVFLQLLDGAVIYASDNATDFDSVPAYTEDCGPYDYPLVYAVNSTSTGIIGSGTLNGGANDPPGHLVSSYDPNYNFLYPKDIPLYDCPPGLCRIKNVVFRDCNNVVVEGVYILNSPLWTFTIAQCDNVQISGVTIRGDRRWPNNDGIDVVDSANVEINHCNITTGDDSICVSTHTSVPSHDIVVRNSYMESTSSALKFGHVSYADMYNAIFDNITIRETNRGMCFMPREGPGSIRNVTFSNIDAETHYFSTKWWGSGEPMYVTAMSDENPYTGVVSQIKFVNITSRSENSPLVAGNPTPVSRVSFESVSITIARWSNYSHPCHDYRPWIGGPQMAYSPTDGIFVDGLIGGKLSDATITFEPPQQSYYGICVNLTARVVGFMETNVLCYPVV